MEIKDERLLLVTKIIDIKEALIQRTEIITTLLSMHANIMTSTSIQTVIIFRTLINAKLDIPHIWHI